MVAPDQPPGTGDAREAIRFLAIKAAIFIGVPVVAAIAAVMLTLK